MTCDGTGAKNLLLSMTARTQRIYQLIVISNGDIIVARLFCGRNGGVRMGPFHQYFWCRVCISYQG